MADKSRCRKQTHDLVGEGVDSEAEVAEEAVDLEGEEVAAMARGIKVEEVSSSSYSCTYSTAQVLLWFLKLFTFYGNISMLIPVIS